MEVYCGESCLAGRDVGTSDKVSEGLSAQSDGESVAVLRGATDVAYRSGSCHQL